MNVESEEILKISENKIKYALDHMKNYIKFVHTVQGMYKAGKIT